MKTNGFIKTQVLHLGEKTLSIYDYVRGGLVNVGDVALFIVMMTRETFSREFEFKEFVYQCYKIGYKSLPLISLTGAIMGLVLTHTTQLKLVQQTPMVMANLI